MVGSTRDSPRWWRDMVLCLSLANLCCLGGWVRIQRAQLPLENYYRQVPLADSVLVAHLLSILLAAFLMWAAIALVRRSGNPLALRFAECGFLLLLILPLRLINTELLGFTRQNLLVFLGRTGLILLGATIGTGPFLIALYHNRIVLRLAQGAVLIFAPLLPVFMAFSAVSRFQAPPATAFGDKTPAAVITNGQPPPARVVWIVFDELDERLAFLERPSNLMLPEFDRLLKQSVRARSAYPPSSSTIVSLPALITGRMISQVEPAGAADLQITFKGASTQVRWSSHPNVFSRARGAGVNTALVGWHNPYCRILGSSLTACSWEPNLAMTESAYQQEIGVTRAATAELRGVASTIPILPKFGAIRPDGIVGEETNFIRRQHQDAYFKIREQALNVLADPRFGLIFLHWPVPHPIGIYNRSNKSFTALERSSYLDNLALVDRTLGEIRRTMEHAGLWEKSFVLVSADHPLRPYEWDYQPTWTAEDQAATAGKESPLIPFLLKLPGQRQSVTYLPAFNTVLSHDLVLASLRGEISSPRTAVQWLDRNRGRFPR